MNDDIASSDSVVPEIFGCTAHFAAKLPETEGTPAPRRVAFGKREATAAREALSASRARLEVSTGPQRLKRGRGLSLVSRRSEFRTKDGLARISALSRAVRRRLPSLLKQPLFRSERMGSRGLCPP
jgi:hypothetical protein